ncbi:MAG: leucine-rich repeat domain-containing protein [Bacteroidales bacterium]
MKTLYYFVTALIFFFMISCKKEKEKIVCTQNIYIPDANLKQAIIDSYWGYGEESYSIDDNGDGEICDGEALNLYALDIAYHGVTDLTGLDYFPNLTRLDCYHNNIKYFNLHHTKLSYLDCSYNNMDSINLSGLPHLAELWCSGNKFKKINTSNNYLLKTFVCSFNLIDTLNLANNLYLDFFSFDDNKLNSINLINNTLLNTIYISNNPIQAINLSKNTELRSLTFGNNNFKRLDISNNKKLLFMRVDGLYPVEEICVWTLPFPTTQQHLVNFENYSIFKICN